jgi:hypothetical protein
MLHLVRGRGRRRTPPAACRCRDILTANLALHSPLTEENNTMLGEFLTSILALLEDVFAEILSILASIFPG